MKIIALSLVLLTSTLSYGQHDTLTNARTPSFYITISTGFGNARTMYYNGTKNGDLYANKPQQSTSTFIGAGFVIANKTKLNVSLETGYSFEELQLSFIKDSISYSLFGKRTSVPLILSFKSKTRLGFHLAFGVNYSQTSNVDSKYLDASPLDGAHRTVNNFGLLSTFGINFNISENTSFTLSHQTTSDLSSKHLRSTNTTINLGIIANLF
jgi:hypothetical protein